MLLLLPISRYRIDYQVAAGRPFSIFEQLILRAIAEGASSLDDLRNSFFVHPRLILEALVTLTQAGWLVVGGVDNRGFQLTSSGREAVTGGTEPRSRVIEPKYSWILMDRLTGGLASEIGVRYLRKQDLAEILDESFKLPERVFDRKLTEAQVEPFLMRARNEWLYRVDSIDMKTRQAHWLPITFDPATKQIDDNLPPAWRARIAAAVLEESQRNARMQKAIVNLSRELRRQLTVTTSSGARRYRVDQGAYLASFTKDDLLVTDADHFEYLKRIFGEATSTIFIASAFLRARCLETLEPYIVAALRRGVSVDFLWGYNSGREGEIDGLEVLRRIAFNERGRASSGKLRFNTGASGSHAKIVIWQGAPGYEACVGSYNWLSVPLPANPKEGSTATNISVRVRQRQLIARLIRSAAGLWDGGRQSLDSAPERWRRIASLLEEETSTPKGEVEDSAVAGEVTNRRDGPEGTKVTIRLVLDIDHEAMLRTWLGVSQQRLWILSHRLGVAAETRLMAAMDKSAEKAFVFSAIYGHSDLPEPQARSLETMVAGVKGQLRCVPGMHAKVVLCDSAVCIGSYNFLSTDVFGTSSKSKEVSLLIEGAEMADFVEQVIKKQAPTSLD